jgi:hypothetical protein
MGCHLMGVPCVELFPVVHEAPSLGEEAPTTPLAVSLLQQAADFVNVNIS